MDLPNWLTAAASVAGVLGTAGAAIIHNSLSSRDLLLESLRRQQATLFEKSDIVVKEFNAYKLHVAENYVNEGKLEKLFDPINRRLESIEKGLREERTRNG